MRSTIVFSSGFSTFSRKPVRWPPSSDMMEPPPSSLASTYSSTGSVFTALAGERDLRGDLRRSFGGDSAVFRGEAASCLMGIGGRALASGSFTGDLLLLLGRAGLGGCGGDCTIREAGVATRSGEGEGEVAAQAAAWVDTMGEWLVLGVLWLEGGLGEGGGGGGGGGGGVGGGVGEGWLEESLGE